MAKAQIKDLIPGKTYRVQVRAVNDNGEYSEWSTSQQFTVPNNIDVSGAYAIAPITKMTYRTIVGDSTATKQSGLIQSAGFNGALLNNNNLDMTPANAGNAGWAIDYSGNAIFNNILARGTIQATQGYFGDWSIGAADGFNALKYTYTSGTTDSVLSYLSPYSLNLAVKNSIFGTNYETYLTALENADFRLFSIRNMALQSTPTDLRNLFYVTTTGLIYSKNGASFDGSISTVGGITNTGKISSDSTTTSGRTLEISNSGATYGSANATITWVGVSVAANTNAYFTAYDANTGGTANTKYKVRLDGTVFSDAGTAMSTPADYAEMFEWLDGNPNNDDRVGTSVVLENGKIREATAEEVPFGVVSGNPAVLGDTAWSSWTGRYLKDEFNRNIYEEYSVIFWIDSEGKEHHYDSNKIPEDIIVPDNHEVLISKRQVENPEFDETMLYVPRQERKEWDAVGMVGKLRLKIGQSVAPSWIKIKDISDTVEEWLVK